MPGTIDRTFGEKYLDCTENFYRYGVHLLFNEWWVAAPQDAIDKYVAAIADHPEQGPLAREGWLAPPFALSQVAHYGPGSLGAAWRDFMVNNGLVEKLAEGYRELTDDFAAQGKLDRMPPILRYKVLRGYQTHDLHHVLTGYEATPFDELALQAFQLAQQDYPYSAMTLSTIIGHAAIVDPWLIKPAMDAITEGWAYGRRTKSIQFVAFETMLHRPLAEVRAEYGLDGPVRAAPPIADAPVPDLLAA
jgi:ubiquinone biosynthesis protein COQ4